MILSDRDLRALIEAGELIIDPFDEESIQPSSIDLRVGNQFRVFANSRHPYIDVRQPMDGLTEIVEAAEHEPFILHPGEFVLGSTLERVALPDDKVGRLEGKSSLGRLGLLIHSSLPEGEPVLFRDEDGQTSWRPIDEIVRKSLRGQVVSFDPETLEVGFAEVTGAYEGPADRIFEIALSSGRRVRVTAGHNLFSLDRGGQIATIRTGELEVGTFVAMAGTIPESSAAEPELILGGLFPEAYLSRLVFTGEAVSEVFACSSSVVEEVLVEHGIKHVSYYRARSRLPAQVGRLLIDVDSPQLQLSTRGSLKTLPNRIPVDSDLAWLFGLYVAEGYHRRNQVVWSNTDQTINDRVEGILTRLGLPSYRNAGSVTCTSALLSMVIGSIGVGDDAHSKRIPPMVFGWPTESVRHFLDGFIDGDGSREDTRTSLWTASEGLATDFLALLPLLRMRAAAWRRARGRSQLFQVSIPHREHKLLTSVPLPDRLLVEIRQKLGLSQVGASRLCGYRHPTDLCKIENRYRRDAVRRETLRRLIRGYETVAGPLEELRRLTSLVAGDVLWDRVVDVRDTGEEAPIFDIEVRPEGRKVENFLAGRGGVFVSNTAGFVDAGFNGYLTLELSNVANLPITIYPGMKIGQLCLFEMTTPAERPYGSKELGSKYLGQEGPTPSRYFENFGEEDQDGV